MIRNKKWKLNTGEHAIINKKRANLEHEKCLHKNKKIKAYEHENVSKDEEEKKINLQKEKNGKIKK